jgi:hypothetical protein
MASITEVLTGYFCEQNDFTLYTNNTGGNVRVIFNYLSIEGTGTNEIRILTPGERFPGPEVDSFGRTTTENVATYIQLPNLPDIETDWIEGIIGRNLSSLSLNYGWYWRYWWGFQRNRDGGGDNPNGYMFLFSREEILNTRQYYFYGYGWNWWRKWGRLQEVPLPTEYFLKPGQSIEFAARKKIALDWRTRAPLSPAKQQITYNVLVMPEC